MSQLTRNVASQFVFMNSSFCNIYLKNYFSWRQGSSGGAPTHKLKPPVPQKNLL
jgi:hypothetical protein